MHAKPPLYSNFYALFTICSLQLLTSYTIEVIKPKNGTGLLMTHVPFLVTTRVMMMMMIMMMMMMMMMLTMMMMMRMMIMMIIINLILWQMI